MGRLWEYVLVVRVAFYGNIMGYFWEYNGNNCGNRVDFIDERVFLGIFPWELGLSTIKEVGMSLGRGFGNELEDKERVLGGLVKIDLNRINHYHL